MMNSNSLQKNDPIKREALDKNDYIRSLAEEAYRTGVISEAEYKSVVGSLFMILSEETYRYTKGRSSSVRTEVAKILLDCVCFKIGLSLMTITDYSSAARILVTTPLTELLKSGERRIDGLLKTAASFYKKLLSNRIAFENYAYNDTLDKDIKQFFKRYNKNFAAHDMTSAYDFSYQLAVPATDKGDGPAGYLIRYEKALFWENEFCSIFPIDEIKKLLAIDDPYGQSPTSIFERLLFNSCANVLLGDPGQLTLTAGDVEYLIKTFDKKLPEALVKACDAFSTKIRGWDEFLAGYSIKTISNSAELLRNAINTAAVLSFFTVEGNNNNKDEYTDSGLRLANEEFRDLSDEIRFCDSIEKKIALFSSVSSLSDFIDLLDSECLYGYEYKKFYAGLDENILKLLSEKAKELEYSGNSSEWVLALSDFLE